MKAVVQDRFGGAGVLKVEETATPVPDATSVLVKVRSASVNGLDWRILSGKPFLGRLLFFGLLRPKQKVRGADVSGEVVSLGNPGSRFKVGDAVFGVGRGSFAEYTAADESELAPKPEGVSFDDAATLGVAACTALQALRDRGHVRPGQDVLITGAGSGVGTFAVQLAKWMGARVTAVSSTENVGLLQEMGADRVVDYRTEDFTARPERYDIILDISGLHSVPKLGRTLKTDGKLVIVGGRGGFSRFMSPGPRRLFLRQRVWAVMGRTRAADLTLLGDLVAQGKLKPVVDRVYSLSEAPQAMARAEEHRARGKLVIHVA